MLQIGSELGQLLVYFLFLYVLGDNWVEWVSHFVRYSSIYHGQNRVLSFLYIIEDGLWDVVELNHDLILTFPLELRQLDLEVDLLISLVVGKLKHHFG